MMPDTPPFENATVERVMQWALDDLLSHGTQPAQDYLAMLPPRCAKIIDDLSSALADFGEDGVKHAFMSICRHIDVDNIKNGTDSKPNWLMELRTKPVPPRDGTEDASTEKEDPRFTTGKNGRRVLKLSSIQDIYNLPDPEYLINRILQTGSVSLLYGVSGTGKTFTCLDLALHIAHGLPWHGKRVKQGPVWYINTEGGRALKKRLKAWYKEHPELSLSPNFKVIPWSLDLREDYSTLLDTLEDQEEVPILITFDNFSMCTDKVNQNLQDEVATILKRLHFIAASYGCHIMAVHHTNKEGDVNGTMAFRNHVDTMIELKKEDKNDKHSPILFHCEKQRDDDPFGDIRTELQQVTIYADPETGEWVTSCVIADCDRTEEQNIRLTELQRNILQHISNFGGENVARTEVLKACQIDRNHEPGFVNAISLLVQKGFLQPPHIEKKRTYYTLTEAAIKLLQNPKL